MSQIPMTDSHLNTIDEETEEEVENTATETVNEKHEETVSEGERQNVNGKTETKLEEPSEKVDSSKKEEKRQCAVCLELIGNNQRSVQPCSCGYEVHYHCLVSGIQTYEATHPGCAPLGCRFCMTPYDISPKKNLAFRVLDRVSFRYGQLCELGYLAVTAVFMDSTFTILGCALFYKVCGYEEAEELLFSMDPVKAVAICKSIPLISIAVNAIPWETKLLRFLRRCSRLPVVGSLFPSADTRVREVKHRSTLFGVLVGGLLLPWHANMLGVKLFGGVESRLHRFLLGAVTFLALKGALQMYYRQRLYARQCFLTVQDYRED